MRDREFHLSENKAWTEWSLDKNTVDDFISENVVDILHSLPTTGVVCSLIIYNYLQNFLPFKMPIHDIDVYLEQ